MTHTDEERIAELLHELPPAPRGLVAAAQELPRARRELDRIVELATADAEFRRALIQDLEATLRLRGIEPDEVVVAELRRRLTG